MTRGNLLAAIILLIGASPVSALTPTQQIFDQTFRRLQSYPVPPYAIWTATWRISARSMGYYTGEQTSTETHRYAVRLADGMENVSDPIPTGKLPPALIFPEFLGPFAWTMRSSVRVSPASSATSLSPDLAGLKTIARVVAVEQPPYSIVNGNSLPPIGNVEGHECYHLRLQPLTDPQKHNLRDVWVDVATSDLRKAHFTGRYAPVPTAPVSPTDVTVYFRNVIGFWVVTRAIWTYDNAPIEFEFDVTNDEIGVPPALPDWLFDAAEYRKHQLDGDPDYIGNLLDRMRHGGAG
jgi:hypothetical protein